MVFAVTQRRDLRVTMCFAPDCEFQRARLLWPRAVSKRVRSDLRNVTSPAMASSARFKMIIEVESTSMIMERYVAVSL